MKPTILGIVIVLALISAAAIFYGGPAFNPAPQEQPLQSYSNDAYGLSFSFPVGYVLSERSGEDDIYHITLIREEDAVPVVGAGEGPRAITIDVHPLEEDMTVLDWMETSPYANFGLGREKTYVDRTMSGMSAFQYEWSGLYEGVTTALAYGKWVYAVSVTFNSPTDVIRSDYERVLDSVRVR